MAIVKKHWKLTVVFLVVIGGASGWLVVSTLMAETSGGETTPPEAQSEPQALDAVTFCRIRALRKELCLRNETIAAIGCDKAAAAEVLAALVEWYQTNKTALDAARAAKEAADEALRKAMQKVNVGPRDEQLLAQIPTLRAAVVKAFKDRKTLVETAIPAIEAKLTASQKAVWQVARTSGMPGKYRYAPDVTAEQARTLQRAIRTRDRRLAIGGTSEAMATANSVFETVEAETLTAVQKTAIAAATANMQENMPGVLGADHETLPLPEELKWPAPTVPSR